MSQFLQRLIQDESGATAIEYGLIITLIALAIVTAVTAVGANISSKLTQVSTSLGS